MGLAERWATRNGAEWTGWGDRAAWVRLKARTWLWHRIRRNAASN